LSTDSKWVLWLVDKGDYKSGHVAKNIKTQEVRPININYIKEYPKVNSFNIEDSNDITVLSSNPTTLSIRSLDDGSIKWESVGINNIRGGYYKMYRESPSSLIHWKWEATSYDNDSKVYVEWDLPKGKGQHFIDGGLLLSNIAADPDGKYIAVVAERHSRIRSYKAEIFVIRTSDGKKIFSRIYRKRNDMSVGFGKGFFAYSHYEENKNEDSESAGSYKLNVYKIPET